jgi:two-component system chemotaxis response regulator CheY
MFPLSISQERYKMFKDKRVLVIDDQIFMFNMIEKNLKILGFEHIDYASTGTKALEMLEIRDYELVTCDITMPEIDGIETARRIFAKHPAQKFLMVTAIGQKYAIAKAVEVGVKHYLLKPFTEQHFIEKVNAIFNH